MLDPNKKAYASAVKDRGSAYFAKHDYDHAIADYSEAIGLDPNNADNYLTRASVCRYAGKYDEAIADFTTVIRLAPKFARAYFERGVTNLYVHSLPKALADLDQASELDPKFAYTALWLDIVGKRNNLPSRLPQAITQIDMTKWPAPVIRLYLGELTPAAVLAAADNPDPATKKGQLCEADFYSGELALQKGAKEDARHLFQLAAADCPKDFEEWQAAIAELKVLGRIRDWCIARTISLRGLVARGKPTASERSPDFAEQNPGSAFGPVDRSRIALRAIRATKISHHHCPLSATCLILRPDALFAASPCHRRRPCGFRGRMADRAARRAGGAARDAAASHDCRAQNRKTRRAGLLQLVPLRRRARQAPIGLLHAEMRLLGSLVMRAADAHKLPAGGALAVDREAFADAITAALEAEPLIDIRREEVSAPPPEWDSVIIATGPLTSPALAETMRALTGEDALAFFDAIAPIVHRDSIDFGHRLVPVALRQGRPRRLRRRLHQLSAHSRAIRGLRRCAAGRRKNRVPRFRGGDAVFRRLPADRSDGRARARDAAPWADEAVRPHRSAPAGAKNPMPWCSCARTTSSARCSTWWGSRPS